VSILEKLDNERAKFVSLYDLVKGISEINQCSISDAACAVSHVIEHEEIDFISRKKSTRLSFNVIDPIHDFACIKHLEEIAEYDGFPPSGDFYLFHQGWYKKDLHSIFLNLVSEGGLSDFANLPCMAEDQISPSYVDVYERKDKAPARKAIKEMRKAFADSQTSSSYEDLMPPYLDSSHPCYSPKLAATIKAWEHAVTEHASSLKTPTKRMEEWLVENESTLGLKTELKKDSKIQMAKIANFRNITGAVTTSERDENAKAMSDYNESANGMKAKLKTNPVSKLIDDEPDFDSESAF
jgi:hypothetical protein